MVALSGAFGDGSEVRMVAAIAGCAGLAALVQLALGPIRLRERAPLASSFGPP